MSDRAPSADPLEAAHAIRHARAADFAAVRRLYRVVQDTHAAHLPELFRASADGDFSAEYFDTVLGQHLLLVAERAGDIVGSLHAHLCEMNFGSSYIPYRSLFIHHVVTDPAVRRGGIARALIAASAEWARENDAERIDLSVWSFNAGALALYRDLGFGEVYTGMTARPADVLVQGGTGWLPKPRPTSVPRVPRWLSFRSRRD